ncbi:hypothetical protein KUTeg_007741 [Tegillarca granosa]|uniref:Uncharacterized protein n=1 Tax=Tegillarca granosa TaxID=220873 RepID=A0ABQ9FE58_TEGGR|nr:hypothetical protein KUTeg_007741 [Tegillarca granosa]
MSAGTKRPGSISKNNSRGSINNSRSVKFQHEDSGSDRSSSQASSISSAYRPTSSRPPSGRPTSGRPISGRSSRYTENTTFHLSIKPVDAIRNLFIFDVPEPYAMIF